MTFYHLYYEQISHCIAVFPAGSREQSSLCCGSNNSIRFILRIPVYCNNEIEQYIVLPFIKAN
jgi:hypothetical protein